MINKPGHTMAQLKDTKTKVSISQIISIIVIFAISLISSIFDAKSQIILLFGPIVLLIGIIFLYRRPILILYILLILAPLDTFFSRLLIVTGITDKGTLLKDGLVFLLLATLLGKGLVSLIKKPKSIKVQRIDLLFVSMVIFLLLQALRLPYLPAGIYGFRSISWFAVIFLFIRYYANENHIKMTYVISFFMSGIVAIYGLMQFIIGPPAIEFLGYAPGDVAFRSTFGFLRVISTTDSAGTMSAYMLIWSCLSVGMLLHQQPRQRRFMFVILTILLLVNLILTTIRAAWLGLGVALIIGWLLNRRMKRQTMPIIMLAFILFTTANIATDGFFANRVLSVVGLGNDPQSHASNDTHLESISLGFDYLAEKPIFGHGVGLTGSPSIKFAANLPDGAIGLDNLYLKFLVETGLVGFVLFIVFFISVIRASFAAYRHAVSMPRKGLTLGILMAFCGLGIMFLLHSILESPLINIMFWMMAATIFFLLRHPEKGAIRSDHKTNEIEPV
jgi:putative inorganic carbon (hco3(-)) transporter